MTNDNLIFAPTDEFDVMVAEGDLTIQMSGGYRFVTLEGDTPTHVVEVDSPDVGQAFPVQDKKSELYTSMMGIING